MDTYRDSVALNDLWNSRRAPWRSGDQQRSLAPSLHICHRYRRASGGLAWLPPRPPGPARRKFCAARRMTKPIRTVPSLPLVFWSMISSLMSASGRQDGCRASSGEALIYTPSGTPHRVQRGATVSPCRSSSAVRMQSVRIPKTRERMPDPEYSVYSCRRGRTTDLHYLPGQDYLTVAPPLALGACRLCWWQLCGSRTRG